MIVACELFEGVAYLITSHGDIWRVQIDAEGYLSVDDPGGQVPKAVIDQINASWGRRECT